MTSDCKPLFLPVLQQPAVKNCSSKLDVVSSEKNVVLREAVFSIIRYDKLKNEENIPECSAIIRVTSSVSQQLTCSV